MKNKDSQKAFTLVELLVAMGILSVLLLLLTSLLGQIQNTWTSSRDRIGQYREARVAFDIITKNLSQATLNTYWDYRFDTATNTPEAYERRSELHFLTFPASQLGSRIPDGEAVSQAVFFQAPLGFSYEYRNLNNLFNGRGYFVIYGSDEEFRPDFVESAPKYRFRLMEFRPPAEQNQVFADGLEDREIGGVAVFDRWWSHSEGAVQSDPFIDNVQPLAENIIAFVVSPRDTIEESKQNRRDTYSEIAANYEFDSNEHPNGKYRQQVPPLVKVTMIAVDETAGVRFEDTSGSPPLLLPEGLFRDTRKYDDDVQAAIDELSAKNINHKVFSTTVMLRSSRWSSSDDSVN